MKSVSGQDRIDTVTRRVKLCKAENRDEMVRDSRLPGPRSYQQGQRVLLSTRNYPSLRPHKLASPYVGPFKIIRVLSSGNVALIHIAYN